MPATPRILVVGSINLDLVVELDRLPLEGETLVGRRMTQVPGGKGANQAVAAARLGAHACFCGRVGDDDWGRRLTDSMAACGVATAGLVADPKLTTGAAVILVERTGKNQIIAVGGANLGVGPADVDAAMAAASSLDALMLTLETPLATVQHAISRGNAMGIPVVLDAAPPADYPLATLRGLTILSPNETEAQSLTGIAIDSIDDARRAARALADGTQAKHVVMKLAERGSLVHTAGGDHWIEPFAVTAIDATAAGDAFTSALTVRMCHGADIAEAARYANAAGAMTTLTLGAQTALPKAAEIEAFLKSRRH